jgi:hypothetical protein
MFNEGVKSSNSSIVDMIESLPYSERLSAIQKNRTVLSDKEVQELAMEYIKEYQADTIEEKTPLNYLKLHIGLACECVPLVIDGINEGAKIDERDVSGHIYNAKLMSALLRLGVIDSFIGSIFTSAVRNGYVDTVSVLLKSDNVTPTKRHMALAVEHNNYRVLHVLMKDDKIKELFSEKDKEYFDNMKLSSRILRNKSI